MRAVRSLGLCALVLFVCASAAAAQDDGVDFVAEPVPGSQTAPGGGYFLLEAAPGEEISQSIGLRNDADEPLRLRLAAVDAVTGQLGGASYELDGETPTRTGSWITLDRTVITLQPRASAIVSFRVAVPTDAETGHHLAGISISVPTQQHDSPEAGQGQAGASIDVQTRRIIAVQVQLPGPADPKLIIHGVTPAARPDGLYLEVAIENDGHGLTKATGVVNVDDFEREFEIDTFVPRTSIAYPVRWTDDADDGEHQAAVELRYGDEIARWDGTFIVGEAVRDELADRQVAATPPPDDNDDPEIPVAVVMGAAAGGAALALGTAGMIVHRFRRPIGKHAMQRPRRTRHRARSRRSR